MKNRKLARLGLIVLAIVLISATVLAVGAARFLGDINNDGKVSVFDAQMLAEQKIGLRTLTTEQKANAGSSTVDSVLEQIWGQTTGLADTDGDGAYELSTADDLYYMAANPTLSYELTRNIDLKGAEWTPVKQFNSSFDGNGYTISNCVINESVDDITKTNGKYDQNMGFFGEIGATGTVTDLKLRDITINATEDAGYIGILVGTNRGSASGINVTGTINDDRTDLNGSKIYVGALAGKIASSATGTITCSASLSVTDDLGKETVTGLSANVRMNIQKTSDSVVMGLVGWAPKALAVSGQWCDSANDSAQLSQTIQDRQKVVVDYADAMATVKWQVSEAITYNAKEGGAVVQEFVPGVTYLGLPYTSMNGSLERFMTQMDTSSGQNITVKGLTDSTYHEIPIEGTEDVIKGYDGFAQYIGNDCSSAVGWAWLRVSPVDEKTGGGVWPRYAIDFIPNSKGQSYGVYPVGNWTVSDTDYSVSGSFAYEIPDDEFNTKYVYDTYGSETLYEAYAVSRTGDALVYMIYDNSSGSGGGHARLIVADPIVIRNADGSIDASKSYLLCTEQGDGLGTRDETNSSWRYHYKYTFSELILVNNVKKQKVFIPVAIRALHTENVKDAFVRQHADFHILSPIYGKVYSNYRIISSTIKVMDGKNKVLFENTAYTGISNNMHVARERHNSVDLATYHIDAFTEGAKAAGMVSGKKYYYSVEVLLSTGKTMTVITKDIFTYTPAE